MKKAVAAARVGWAVIGEDDAELRGGERTGGVIKVGEMGGKTAAQEEWTKLRRGSEKRYIYISIRI